MQINVIYSDTCRSMTTGKTQLDLKTQIDDNHNHHHRMPLQTHLPYLPTGSGTRKSY